MSSGRVVVGVSGSPSSVAALRRGAEEAWRSGRVLVPVRAWEPPEGELVHARFPSPELAAVWEQRAGQRLAGLLAEVLGAEPCLQPQQSAAGLRIEPLVVRAPAWHALPLLAAEPEDLLVLGGGGQRFGLLRGRVRRRVLARAVCPVLAVPPPTASRALRRALRNTEPADFVLS